MKQKETKTKRIGILGGAFNPPHFGHLKIARKAIKLLKLDELIFMPTGIPTLPKKDLASSKNRLEMVKILTKFNPKFSISEYEIKKAKKGKPSYTLETIKYLKRKFKNVKFFWIIGEDSFCEIVMNKWKHNSKVLDLMKFVVFSRKKPHSIKNLPKKYQKKAKELLKKVIYVKNFNIPISATEIRERVKKGKSIKNLLPKEIELYIKSHRLYSNDKK